MAKLVTKFKYRKPNRKVSAGGYAKYIATREGVEKIDDTKKFAPATAKQKNLIEKIIKDFPDSKDMFEYSDYLEKQNVGSASDFISRVMEDYAYEISGRRAYADYIATRPRAEKFGSHGLFTADHLRRFCSKQHKCGSAIKSTRFKNCYVRLCKQEQKRSVAILADDRKSFDDSR